MKLRWFLSPVLRQAVDVTKHVRKLLHAQKDILSSQSIEAVNTCLNLTQTAIDEDQPDLVLLNEMKRMDEVVGKMIKPYPSAQWRENIEVMLVAIVVAMGIRTFFVQPFKIPTGSMQPTLYGNTMEDMRQSPASDMPGPFGRIFQAVAYGRFYHEFVPSEHGTIMEIKPVGHIGKFINYQDIMVQYANTSGLTKHTFWFVPDDGIPMPNPRNPTGAGLVENLSFNKGNVVMRFKEDTGDHLFVDRLTYNFRHPKRGEIVVFKTKGTAIPDQTQFYIKRLIGLPNEKISIGDDRHVRINGKRLDASTPHFENIYGFDPKSDPQPSQYSGHAFYGNFDSPQYEHQISPNHFMVFGDNTLNSSDSRYWGEVPDENIIGKSWLVYWPITTGTNGRFGWGQK